MAYKQSELLRLIYKHKNEVFKMLMLKKRRSSKKSVVIEDIVERYIRAEERGLTPVLPLRHTGASVGRKLNPMRLAEIRKCPECKFNPVVYLLQKKIPCCLDHWDKLATAQIGGVRMGNGDV
jgi:hypothetical protein